MALVLFDFNAQPTKIGVFITARRVINERITFNEWIAASGSDAVVVPTDCIAFIGGDFDTDKSPDVRIFITTGSSRVGRGCGCK
jgi:hypothetical protein